MGQAWTLLFLVLKLLQCFLKSNYEMINVPVLVLLHNCLDIEFSSTIPANRVLVAPPYLKYLRGTYQWLGNFPAKLSCIRPQVFKLWREAPFPLAERSFRGHLSENISRYLAAYKRKANPLITGLHQLLPVFLLRPSDYPDNHARHHQ